jgi:predicted metal-dependent enzyme (double-stranded beta helix superfamily)
METLPDKVSLDTLEQCVLEVDIRKLPLDEYISFADQGYKRNLVHVSSKCEVVVLCFKEGQITPIHDHGGSIGITVVLDGIMTEELFNKQQTGVILHTLTREFRIDELSHTYLTTIHRVSNAHTGRLVIIHIYFPPLTLMNIYNLKDTHIEKWTADYANKL